MDQEKRNKLQALKQIAEQHTNHRAERAFGLPTCQCADCREYRVLQSWGVEKMVEDADALREGIRKAGFGVMKCSNGTFIADITAAEHRQSAKELELIHKDLVWERLEPAIRKFMEAFDFDASDTDGNLLLQERLASLPKALAELRPLFKELEEEKKPRDRKPFGPVIPDEEVDRNFIQILIRAYPGVGAPTLGVALLRGFEERGMNAHLQDEEPLPPELFTETELEKRLTAMQARGTRFVIVTQQVPWPK